jgi:hypothetical protein
MYGSLTGQGASTQQSATAPRGSEATLNEQLARDPAGKLRDEVLDELAVAAQDIEAALEGRPAAAQAEVLSNLLGAIRLGEIIVAQVWDSFHG